MPNEKSSVPIHVPASFPHAKLIADELDAICKSRSRILQGFPRNAMGLVSDQTRISPEYQVAKLAYDVAFTKLRDYNAAYTKRFAAEIKADRDARRQAKYRCDGKHPGVCTDIGCHNG